MPFVDCAGHSLEYEWVGDAASPGPSLVFLHEGLGSIRQWRDFPAQVARATGRRALVYSRYGYGQSDVMQEAHAGVRFMHRGALEELPALLAALGVARPVLVGHSDGASIALIYAGAGHPVSGLALMAPHVFVEPICVTSIERANATFASGELAAGLAKYHRDASRTFHLWADAWLESDFLQWNIESYLPGIECPVLALQGVDDAYGTMEQLARIARGVRGPCERLELADCGHSPFREQPQRTLEAIARFVNERCS
ncbi:MAG TPA: alpha/beta hydrolase [Burkholderiales bacterium]|nr:alpha/beta hydrolase [Burkholderiales bacterium]